VSVSTQENEGRERVHRDADPGKLGEKLDCVEPDEARPGEGVLHFDAGERGLDGVARFAILHDEPQEEALVRAHRETALSVELLVERRDFGADVDEHDLADAMFVHGASAVIRQAL
jgi:hypothetical protein